MPDLNAMTPDQINAARDAQEQDQALQLRSNLMQNTDSDPAKAAAALPIARDKGLPLETVENNLPHFQKLEQYTPDAINQLRDNTPILAEFLAQPEAARVAHPDIPVLQKIENAANDTMMGMAAITNATVAGQDPVSLALLRSKQLSGTNTPQDDAQAEAISQRMQGDAGATMSAGDANMGPAGRAILNAAGMVPMLAEIGKQSLIGGLGGAAVGAAAGMATPAEVATLPAGTGLGMKAGQMHAEYQIFAGQAYDQLLKVKDDKGQGLDPEIAKATARVIGIANAGLMHVSIGTLTKTIPGIRDLFTGDALKAALQSPQARAQLMNIARNYTGAVATGGAVMGAQTGISDAGEDLAKTLSPGNFEKKTFGEVVQDVLRAAGEGAAMSAVAALPGTAMTAGVMMVRRNGQMHPQATAEYVKNVTKLAKSSDLRALSPDMFKEFVGNTTKDADFYMPVDQATKLYQSIPPEDRPAFDAAVPDFQAKLAEAAVTGADVKVSQADYFTHLADHAPGDMADHLTFDPAHISNADFQDEQMMRRLMTEGMLGASEDELLHRSLADQFENAGLTPDVSHKYALIATARYKTMMERYGDNDKAAAAVQELADNLVATRELPEFIGQAHKADELDVLISRARSLKQGGPEAKHPILAWLRGQGGLDPASNDASELRAMGIDNKTMPGLFVKKRRLSSAGGNKEVGGVGLDNIPHHEFEAIFGHAGPKNGEGANVDTGWLFDAINDEVKLGKKLEPVQRSREDVFIEELDRLGIDIDKASNAKIKKAIADYLAAQHDQSTLFQREGAPGLRSTLADAAHGLKQEKGSGEQMLAMLKATPGVKEEEIAWTGLDEFLKGKKSVTRQQIADYLDQNQVRVEEVVLGDDAITKRARELAEAEGEKWDSIGGGGQTHFIRDARIEAARNQGWDSVGDGPGETKFQQYTLPGGENYREVLLTLPASPDEHKFEVITKKGDIVGAFDTQKEADEWAESRNRQVRGIGATVRERKRPSKDDFRSSHFDQANILAHLRLDDRTDADGKKVLFIEELQSDWHQAGRKKGYKGQKLTEAEKREKYYQYMTTKEFPVEKEGARALADSLPPEQLDRAINHVVSEGSGAVPDAPFKKTWHEMALRRAIQMAAQDGYDRIAWTTGEQQAERFDLSKQVDKIAVPMVNKENRSVRIDSLDGKSFKMMVDNKGIVDGFDKASQFSGKPLDEVVGKDMAEKIMKLEEPAEYSDEGLKVGGEGMKGFYDKILPAYAKKFGKKFGAEVLEIKLQTADKKALDEATRQGDSSAIGNSFKLESVHALDITPAMRESADKFPLFQNEPGNADLIRGYIQFEGDMGAKITLTKNADLTTTLHELAHWFAFTQRKLAGLDERAAADWEALKKHLGAEGQDHLTIAQEEQFAKMFEVYLAEGKAPSVELESAFHSFKAWIKQAYRRLMGADGSVDKALGVKLNDEVRGFFDRMLATDDQIDQLRRQPGFAPSAEVLDVLTKAEQERYKTLSAREDQADRDRLMARATGQKNREYTEAHKAARAQVMAENQTAVLHSPLYRAMNFLRHGKFHDGDTESPPAEFKLSRKKAREMLGKELADRLPDSYYGRSGVSPDYAAEALGYGNGRDFLLALLNAEPAKARIERMTNDEMMARHGDMLRDGTMEREAIEVAHSELRAKRLEMEGRAVAEKAQIRFPPGTNFRAAARQIIGERNVVDAGNANRYYLAGKAAARAFGKAIAKKDFFKAAAEKQKELLNHHLYREAMAARRDVEKATQSWRRLKKPDAKLTGTAKGRMDVNFLSLARGIQGRYGVMAFRQDVGRYFENLKQIDPQSAEDIRVAYEDQTAGAKPWKKLTLSEFRGLRDAVDNIVSVGKGQNEMTLAGKKVQRDDVLNQLEAALDAMNPSGLPSGLEEALSDLQKVKKGFYSFKSLFVRMEAWAKVMDRGHRGLFHDVFINPVYDAKDRYTARRDAVLGDLYAILGPRQQDLLDSGKITAAEIGYTFQNKAELIGMLLHTGNDSNYEKLWRGRKWSPDQIQTMLERIAAQGILTEADHDLVQSLWDVAEGLKPDAWRAFREMYGHYPEEVTARPVEVKFRKDGEMELATKTLRGGYWPAIVDRTLNEDAAIKQDRDNIVASNATGLFPSTTLGPTKSRVENYAAPLSFDLNLLPNHIDKMLRITYLQPAVRDVAKIALHPRFRQAMATVNPGIARTAIVPYLWRAVNQVTEIDSTGGIEGIQKLNRWANALRRSAAGQTLMYNIPNGIQQLTGLAPSMKATGTVNMLDKMGLYAQDPKGFVADIHEKSAFMKSRLSIIGQETRRGVDDILKGKTDFQKTAEAMNKQGYVFYRMFQGFADHVTWAAAYDNAISGTMPKDKGTILSEADAVRYADRIVRETQGSAEPESIATYEAGPAWMKLFTMFSGYWNSQANMIGSDLYLLMKDYAGRGGSKELAMIYLMGIAIPGILSRFIYDGIKGNLPDDKKKLALWLAGAQVNQTAGMIPFVGGQVNALWNKYAEGRPAFNDSVFSSPAMSALTRAVHAPGEAIGAMTGKTDPGKALMDTMYALGLVSGIVPGSPLYGIGLPLGQLGKPAGYALDVVTGHAKPKGVLPLVQGMVVGPKKDNTK